MKDYTLLLLRLLLLVAMVESNVPHPLSRRLFFDLLDECHLTPSLLFLEKALGPLASSPQSDYFNLGMTVNIDGEKTEVFFDPQLLGLFYLLSQIEGGSVDLNNVTLAEDEVITSELQENHLRLAEFWNMSTFLPHFHLVGVRAEDVEGNIEIAMEPFIELLVETIPDLTYRQADFDKLSSDVQRVIEQDLPLSYANPSLSLNAFVNSPGQLLRGKYAGDAMLAIGQGIMDFVSEVSQVDDVGAAFIHAHEFSHGVDFYLFLEEKGLLGDRKGVDIDSSDFSSDELKADAMAAYALAHERGLNSSEEVVSDSLLRFFNRRLIPSYYLFLL